MSSFNSSKVEIWTEGPTDIIHLKKAYEKLYDSDDIQFKENQRDQGDQALLKKCEVFSEKFQNIPMVFIFDRDNKTIIKNVTDQDGGFKVWGNNVFSFSIPVPKHREGYENLCIELFYTDKELQTKDKYGHRIFLTSEFNKNSGKLKTDSKIHISNKSKLRGFSEKEKAKIIDSEVYDADSQNVALSKMQFAKYIFGEDDRFGQFNFAAFRQIFDIVHQIIDTVESVCAQDDRLSMSYGCKSDKYAQEAPSLFLHDRQRRSIENFLYGIRDYIQSQIRRVCIGNSIFPPMEMDYDEDINRNSLIITTLFPASKKHNLNNPLSIILRFLVLDLEKQRVCCEYSVFQDRANKKLLPKLRFESLYDGRYEPDTLKETISKLFPTIAKKAGTNCL